MFDKNEKYKIDSGMGGSFSVKYVRENETHYIFKITNKGWQQERQIAKDMAHTVKKDS